MPRKTLLHLESDQREALLDLSRRHEAPVRRVCQALLALADGRSVPETARELGCSRQTLYTWRQRFQTEGIDFVRQCERHRRGRPLPADLKQQVLEVSRQLDPPLTARDIAAQVGVSQAVVCKLWKQYGVTPPSRRSKGGTEFRGGETRSVTGLKGVARAAGVSVSTASTALRGGAGVADETRARVLHAAKSRGYAPHPYVSALMARLHRNRFRDVRATIAWIWGGTQSFSEACQVPFGPGRRFKAARERAAQLGYRLEPFWLNEPGLSAARLVSILKSRGIFGAILDIRAGFDISVLAAFRTLACVSFRELKGYSFHVVRENGYCDMLQICLQLWEKGYRRLGFCLSEHAEKDYQFASAAAFDFVQNSVLPAQDRVPLLFPDRASAQALSRDAWLSDNLWQEPKLRPEYSQLADPMQRVIAKWYQRFRPEVIVTNPTVLPVLSKLSLRVPEEVGLVHRNLNADVADWTGIQKNDEATGAAAAELLAQSVEQGEFGERSQPRQLLFSGRWFEGRTTLARCRPTVQVSAAQLDWLRSLANA